MSAPYESPLDQNQPRHELKESAKSFETLRDEYVEVLTTWLNEVEPTLDLPAQREVDIINILEAEEASPVEDEAETFLYPSAATRIDSLHGVSEKINITGLNYNNMTLAHFSLATQSGVTNIELYTITIGMHGQVTTADTQHGVYDHIITTASEMETAKRVLDFYLAELTELYSSNSTREM